MKQRPIKIKHAKHVLLSVFVFVFVCMLGVGRMDGLDGRMGGWMVCHCLFGHEVGLKDHL